MKRSLFDNSLSPNCTRVRLNKCSGDKLDSQKRKYAREHSWTDVYVHTCACVIALRLWWWISGHNASDQEDKSSRQPPR